MRRLIILATVLAFLLFALGAFDQYGQSLQNFFKAPNLQLPSEKVKIVSEESVVVDIVEKITPSVVTVGIEQRIVEIDPFDPFSFFERPRGRQQEQDIGSGFVVSSDGLIVTNKHVVSSSGKYKVITHDGKKYDVVSIYRDPANDIAIIKINTNRLKPVEMGESSKVKVGQLVVAVGTPLGEFRGSVTKGIVSGLGRGITAGSPFEGFAERLDDVIQTDAAINPGNSGGPLVNSSGQVIGVNTAVASGAENIGFAIPINVVKDALTNFKQTGGFTRPYLGVAYQMISREAALRNNLPEGAYVQEVVEGAAAHKAGVTRGDIIVEFDGKKVRDINSSSLAALIAKKKVGDTVKMKVFREDEAGQGKTVELTATLETAPNQ